MLERTTSFWELFRQKHKNQLEISKQIDAVREVVANEWPELSREIPGTVDDLEKKRKILETLYDEEAPEWYEFRRRVFAHFLSYGNKKNYWHIDITSYVFEIHLPASLHSPHMMAGLCVIDCLDHAFLAALEIKDNFIEPEKLLGLIFFSLLRHTCALDLKALRYFLEHGVDCIRYHDRSFWLTVEENNEDERKNSYRITHRYRLHDNTLSLIYAWTDRGYGIPGQYSGKKPHTKTMPILHYIKLGITFPRISGSTVTLNRLRDWIKYAHSLNSIPRYILEWASGNICSYPLNVSGMKRLFGIKSDSSSSLALVQSSDSCKEAPCESHDEQTYTWQDVSRIVKNNSPDMHIASRGKVTKFLDSRIKMEQEISGISLVVTVLSWFKSLLLREGKKVKTAHNLMKVIVNRKTSNFMSESIHKMDELDFLEFYETILSGCSGATRKRYSNTIKTYHDYLVREWGACEISYDDIDGFTRRDMPSTPVLITPVEYDCLKKRYCDEIASAKTDLSKRRAWSRLIIVILATRSGLRAYEIRNLRLFDITLYGNRVLHVRPHGKSLKSSNARRKLPLTLLSAEEQGYLDQWLAIRHNETGGQTNQWLISHHDKPGAISYSYGFHEVNQALKTITGSPNASLHWCRHAMANWTLIAVEDPHGSLRETLPGFQSPSFDEERVNVIRALFLGVQPLTGAWLYEFAEVLANRMGHASPSVTFRHYIHVMDLILGAATSCHSPKLTNSMIENLLSIRKTRRTQRFPLKKYPDGISARDLVEQVLPQLQKKLAPAFPSIN